MATSIDRRTLVSAGAAALGSAALGVSLASADEAKAPDTPWETTVAWDAEYDVIVVGMGGAGMSSAITAADEGAKVLLLEKAPEGDAGGNSNICMQWVCYTEDPDGVLEYFKALRGDWETPSDAILDTYIEGMTHNKEWLESLGAPNVQPLEYAEYPTFPGVESFQLVTVDGSTGMKPPHVFGGNGAAYNLLKDNVVARADAIDVWYGAPAKKLVQDPATKVIHGVEAEVAGETVAIRAKNGVVLACGGYENNPRMQQDYAQRGFWPSTGRVLYNEGDGIKMALDVNANLWHMSNVVTNNGEFHDEATQTSTFGFGAFGAGKGVYIGPDGSRVFDGSAHHGKVDVNGEFRNASIPQAFWDVWDQAIQDLGPINQTWSADSSEEIAKGWIVKADTLEELAGLMGLDAAAVAQTIDEYNGFAADGYDPLYHRNPDTMKAIATAPFYACKLRACMGNTQGGPERNERGEVLDTDGNPIPHLYESGELGDIWSNLYQAACNLGGGMIFGRISGKNAAEPKSDSVQDDLVTDGFRPQIEEKVYEVGENQYIGRGKGKGQAPMVVRVTMDGGKIAGVEVLEHFETDGMAAVSRALENYPAAIVEAGSTDVDMVAGATRTCSGILAAVLDAVSQA